MRPLLSVQRTFTAVVLTAGCSILASSCATGGGYIERDNQSNDRIVRRKASAQFDCPKEKVRVDPIANDDGYHVSWEVQACGTSAMYAFSSGSPILESVDGNPSGKTDGE